jgi:hypothetical protein
MVSSARLWSCGWHLEMVGGMSVRDVCVVFTLSGLGKE